MPARLTILPDERLTAVRGVVEQRLRQAAALACDGAFDDFFDATMRALFCRCLEQLGAHEGTVWLLDEPHTALVPRFNNGPHAARFVGTFRQKLNAGMISAVVATEQPMCENAVQHNQQQDRSLDRQLAVRTCAMLAVPFYFAGELHGVLSAVQLMAAHGSPPEPPGFPAAALDALQACAAILAGLLERRLLGHILGLEADA